ncbi:MAG: hypothetical protein IT373_07920 [Polyangiaceae bacterium]|nr:hypothetical protein [Polyangiaceae bacterium]
MAPPTHPNAVRPAEPAMSLHPPLDASPDRLRRFCARVASAMASRPILNEKIAAWEELAEECLSVDVATKKGDDEVEAAQARARLEDADWRHALHALAARALALAGEKPGAPPYETLFGRVNERDVAELGSGKAELGARLVGGLEGLLGNAPGWRPLGPLAEALSVANQRLAEAFEGLGREEELVLGFELARAKLARRVAHEADLTCAFVLAAFPGRYDLLSAIFGETDERPGSGRRL